MSDSEIIQMLVAGQNDLEWFNSNLNKLKSEYNNMFIAFSNEKIIDADQDVETLIQRLNKKGLDVSSIFIEFVSDIKFIF